MKNDEWLQGVSPVRRGNVKGSRAGEVTSLKSKRNGGPGQETNGPEDFKNIQRGK